MQRKVERKLTNSSGICKKLLHFLTKHISFSISKTVILGSRKPEDYEISIEYIERGYQKTEDKQNIQKEIKMERKKLSDAKGGEKVEDDEAVTRKKKPSMAKNEKRRRCPHILCTRQLGGTRSMGLGPASSRLSISDSSCSRVLSLFLIVSLLARSAHGIYCDEDDCYELLGVSQNANASEIKKAYYKLSLKYHPDKNPDPESRKLFVKIANAYEILKDEATRVQYDYAVLHPEEVFYNTARYYHAYYGYKTDPRAVLVGVLLVVSALQYLNQWSRYNQALNMVKKTPAYKNRLKALELERNGLVTNKKKANRQMDKKVEEELSNELDLQIQGAEKPTIWNIFAIQFILLPYVVGKTLLWKFCWFWRYQIMKAPLTWDDASYLTQSCLKVPRDAWLNMDESAKKNLVMKRLWDKANMESYLAEMRRESKRRR